jgi:hypothetical protein
MGWTTEELVFNSCTGQTFFFSLQHSEQPWGPPNFLVDDVGIQSENLNNIKQPGHGTHCYVPSSYVH